MYFNNSHGNSCQRPPRQKEKKDQLIMVENLNIKVDKIIGKNVSTPKSIHIRNTSMAVYINKTYILKNVRREIRPHCGVQEAARFLKNKYHWTQ